MIAAIYAALLIYGIVGGLTFVIASTTDEMTWAQLVALALFWPVFGVRWVYRGACELWNGDRLIEEGSDEDESEEE